MVKQSEYRVAMREALKNYLDERKRRFKASNGGSVGDCVQRGKEGPCGTYDDRMCMIDDQDIQIQWQHIEMSLTMLRNMLIERANMEFWGRLEMITKGMK